MSSRQDEIHLLGDLFEKLFDKWALSPRSGEIFFRTWTILKFVEIMDVHDETHIIRSCYAARWEK